MGALERIGNIIFVISLIIMAVPIIILVILFVGFLYLYDWTTKILYSHSIYIDLRNGDEFKEIARSSIKRYRFVIRPVFYEHQEWDEMYVKGYKFRFLKEKDKTWCILKSKC